MLVDVAAWRPNADTVATVARSPATVGARNVEDVAADLPVPVTTKAPRRRGQEHSRWARRVADGWERVETGQGSPQRSLFVGAAGTD